MTYEMRLATPGSSEAASYALMVAPRGSEPTANWSRQASVEKRLSVSMSSCEMPITRAPSAANLGLASAKALASMVQPCVKALGKKYSTTGPFFRASARSKSNGLPASAAVVLNSGAASPGLSAACAPIGSRAARASVATCRCFMVFSPA